MHADTVKCESCEKPNYLFMVWGFRLCVICRVALEDYETEARNAALRVVRNTPLVKRCV